MSEESAATNPVDVFCRRQGVMILDGGLATELEARGYDLRHKLWSARLLPAAPEAIRQVHLDYLRAGADCIISASYQATIPGFMAQGLSETKAVELLRLSVELALAARDRFWREEGAGAQGRLRPLVAASIGPYAAYLADGSEYTGDYGWVGVDDLVAFHRQRWQILAGSGADLFACETIPSFTEAQALARLLAETPGPPAWVSFSCRDERHISDGTPLADCVALFEPLERVIAVGVNCTPPVYIAGLAAALRRSTEKMIVVYPNSGELYDKAAHAWRERKDDGDFAATSPQWYQAGARLIGGCCRTNPRHIKKLRQILLRSE